MTGSGKTIAYCIPVFEILMKATRNHDSNSGSRSSSSSSASCNVDKDRTTVFVNKQDVYAMIIAPTR
jgi:superfamily II DNA/RNA helicase